MTSRYRLLSIGSVLVLLAAALLLGRPASSAVLYTGYARADNGPLSLEVTVDPPIAQPGHTLRVKVRISNRGAQPLSPSVVLRLPRGVAADALALPSGATLNLQDHRVDWLPVVPGGAALDFTLDAIVETADVLTPEQKIGAVIRHQGQEQAAAADIWLGIPPLIGELMPQTQVAVGQPIRLTADVVGPGPLKTVWDLGDGRRLDLAEPVVVFPGAGRYEIALEASNPAGAVARRVTLDVLPQPVASFRPDDDAPAIGQSVTFTNESGGQPPLRVFWDFGDGTTLMGEQQPVHAYRQGGTYRVRLTVENDFGSSEAVWDVVVGEAPSAEMVIAERAAVGQPLAGQAFAAVDTTRFVWDMGDGRRHEGATVSHFYRRPGSYYVTLIADNGFGQTQTGQWVTIDPGVSTLFVPMAAFQTGDTFANLSADAPADLDPVVATLDEVFTLAPIAFPPGTGPAEQLYAYVNAARSRFSLAPLAYNFELSAATQSHARDKAVFPDNAHVGSDGTTAAERLLRAAYRGGYAGEATAWGFADPRLAVEFWMNSDSHRPLLLNRLATDLGVGFVEDQGTANVWHWTAEFGVSYGAPARAVLRAQTPAAGQAALDSEVVNYSWLWPLPLGAGQRFVVYLQNAGRAVALGSVHAPVYGSRYILSADARSMRDSPAPAAAEWFVRLEDGLGQVLAESARQAIAFSLDPSAPNVSATVALSPTPTTPTATPTATPWPVTPAPTVEPPPLVVTATPPAEPTVEPPPVIATPEPSPTLAIEPSPTPSPTSTP